MAMRTEIGSEAMSKIVELFMLDDLIVRSLKKTPLDHNPVTVEENYATYMEASLQHRETVIRQIVCWCAAVIAADRSMRDIMTIDQHSVVRGRIMHTSIIDDAKKLAAERYRLSL